MLRVLTLAAVCLLSAPTARAQDAVEPMPPFGRMPSTSVDWATACGAGEVAACTRLADERLRAGDGAAANALYRRAADLARTATTPAALGTIRVRVRSIDEAVAALEASWAGVVVPAATAHGLGDFARDARSQIFGPTAVTSWRGRRARRSDAFRTVHTMRTREEATWVDLAWIGDDAALAAAGEVWELTFGWMGLDFVAYVDDAGAVIAIVHPPEG